MQKQVQNVETTEIFRSKQIFDNNWYSIQLNHFKYNVYKKHSITLNIKH